MRKRWWFAGLAATVMLPAAVPAQALSVRASVKLRAFIVLFDDSVDDADEVAEAEADRFGGEVTEVFDGSIRGFVGRFPTGDQDKLKRRPGVRVVAPDGPVSIATVQDNAPWGLDRIDQVNLKPLDQQYHYTLTGQGVTAYVLDTGIRTTHTQFGGRASVGFDALGGNGQDCHGHGTHVAGTLGGSTYGVAKEVDLVAVRVLGCSGSGSWSSVVAGINWVTNHHEAAGTPAVANMSISGGRNDAVDAALKDSIEAGVTYAVAAGNNGRDACRYSPARVSKALTVGSVDKYDRKASSSNYGKCVDWFAPGVSILSATRSSDTATATLSGTSMASPHTAGVAALYLEAVPAATPAAVDDALELLTTKDIVRSSNTSHNDLLFTNF